MEGCRSVGVAGDDESLGFRTKESRRVTFRVEILFIGGGPAEDSGKDWCSACTRGGVPSDPPMDDMSLEEGRGPGDRSQPEDLPGTGDGNSFIRAAGVFVFFQITS